MGINIRQKGAGGEREIADDLNFIIYQVMGAFGHPEPTMRSVQRNQNQSAVGGADLTGTLGLSIEVKRQEQLSVNTWWAQCTKAAEQNGGIPVLLYRQNGKKWRCVMHAELVLPEQPGRYRAGHTVRVETDYDAFKDYFRVHVGRFLEAGGQIVV